MEKARHATPPPRVPRGYFDALVTPTRVLLDRGLKLHAAADWLIQERALEPRLRARFLNAMRARMSRFRGKQAAAGEVFMWRCSLGYERAHAVGSGTVALCGARAARWLDSTETTPRCKVCAGKMRTQNITMPG